MRAQSRSHITGIRRAINIVITSRILTTRTLSSAFCCHIAIRRFLRTAGRARNNYSGVFTLTIIASPRAPGAFVTGRAGRSGVRFVFTNPVVTRIVCTRIVVIALSCFHARDPAVGIGLKTATGKLFPISGIANIFGAAITVIAKAVIVCRDTGRDGRIRMACFHRAGIAVIRTGDIRTAGTVAVIMPTSC